MSRKNTRQIIQEYLSGKHSEEGEALFNAWYNSHNDNESPLESLSPTEKEKIRLSMLENIKEQSQISKKYLNENPKSRVLQDKWYQFAAVIAGLVLISLSYFIFYQNVSSTVTIQTAYGEIKKVTLPDGSDVTLNANSSLKYSDAWKGQDNRQVWLEGEAFFSVVHTVDHQRFQVITPDMQIEVLGTEFNVNKRDENTEVVLLSGKVKLDILSRKEQDALYMEPGDWVGFSANDNQVLKKVVNTDQHAAWRNHDLVLDNISLEEIAEELENHYGYEIIIADDSLKIMKLSATARLSLKDTKLLFAAISEIYGIEIKKEKDKIIFSRR